MSATTRRPPTSTTTSDSNRERCRLVAAVHPLPAGRRGERIGDVTVARSNRSPRITWMTSLPKALKTWANSAATSPPKITIDRGRSSRYMIVSDVCTRTESKARNVRNGGAAARSEHPSIGLDDDTRTGVEALVADESAVPVYTVMFGDSGPSRYLAGGDDRIDAAEHAIAQRRPVDGVDRHLDAEGGAGRAPSARSAGCTNIFVGTQPTLRHVPPNLPRSTMAMSRSSNSDPGIELPDPAPMITRSWCGSTSTCSPTPRASDSRSGRSNAANALPPMADRALLLAGHLGERPPVAVRWPEHAVVAESATTTGIADDLTVAHPFGEQLAPIRPHHHRAIRAEPRRRSSASARSAAASPSSQHPTPAAGEGGRVDAGPAAEAETSSPVSSASPGRSAAAAIAAALRRALPTSVPASSTTSGTSARRGSNSTSSPRMSAISATFDQVRRREHEPRPAAGAVRHRRRWPRRLGDHLRLQLDDLGEPECGQFEHRGQLGLAERRPLRRLDLDETVLAAAERADRDDVHVDVGHAVLGIGEVDHRHGATMPTLTAAQNECIGWTVSTLAASSRDSASWRARNPPQMLAVRASRRRPAARRSRPDLALGEQRQIARRPQRATDQPLDLHVRPLCLPLRRPRGRRALRRRAGASSTRPTPAPCRARAATAGRCRRRSPVHSTFVRPNSDQAGPSAISV